MALFSGGPLVQADGRVAMQAVLRIKAALAPDAYQIVPGEVELRNPSGALVPAASATVRTEALSAGDPPALVVPEAGGFSFDAATLGSASHRHGPALRRRRSPGRPCPAPTWP